MLIAGNWKMNGLASSLGELTALKEALAQTPPSCEVLVCPPASLIAQANWHVKGAFALGGQDCHPKDKGAFTGDISAEMLKDAGASYVIVGHSERRQYHGETCAQVARKFAAARAGGLTPILCLGETLAQRQAGETEEVVARQLKAVLDLNGIGSFDTAVIAYEPLWAIGTGHSATPEQAQHVHAFIRSQLEKEDAMIARLTRLLYGGSVKAANAAELFAQADVDGGLIGGASLASADFLGICAAAH